MTDLMLLSRKMPSVPMQRRVELADLFAARKNCATPIQWSAIFTKAYSLVSAQMPFLRRSYLGGPFSRIFEHANNVVSLGIEREYRGEQVVVFARLENRDKQSLDEVHQRIVEFKRMPIEQIKAFRNVQLISSLPYFTRRTIWSSA